MMMMMMMMTMTMMTVTTMLWRELKRYNLSVLLLISFSTVVICRSYEIVLFAVLFYAEKYGITPERPHSSVPVEDIVIEAARQLPLYFSRFFVVKVSGKCRFQCNFLVVCYNELNQFLQS